MDMKDKKSRPLPRCLQIAYKVKRMKKDADGHVVIRKSVVLEEKNEPEHGMLEDFAIEYDVESVMSSTCSTEEKWQDDDVSVAGSECSELLLHCENRISINGTAVRCEWGERESGSRSGDCRSSELEEDESDMGDIREPPKRSCCCRMFWIVIGSVFGSIMFISIGLTIYFTVIEMLRKKAEYKEYKVPREYRYMTGEKTTRFLFKLYGWVPTLKPKVEMDKFMLEKENRGHFRCPSVRRYMKSHRRLDLERANLNLEEWKYSHLCMFFYGLEIPKEERYVVPAQPGSFYIKFKAMVGQAASNAITGKDMLSILDGRTVMGNKVYSKMACCEVLQERLDPKDKYPELTMTHYRMILDTLVKERYKFDPNCVATRFERLTELHERSFPTWKIREVSGESIEIPDSSSFS